MLVEAAHSVVALGDHVLRGGENVLEVTAENAPLVAGAEAAGTIRVLEATDAERALLDGHVESQEDGEAAYDAAVADGRWAEGQAVELAAEEADLAAHEALEADAPAEGDS
jgi:hypothetical protein